ncbi:dihydrofolate reductase [Rhodopseudomonas faecalis]|uniref:Dihydrofolate reductase n=1 Tax=Rhodopseudomonas faecalis TaxID=99655 RepID=A0A318THM7_9BRAD|nr:dihydrofolate reductase [Rhodopseudomonas faecalis]
MSAPVEIVLVVAVADNGVIGLQGAMPWRLRSDLRRFKALTIGKPVLMGRKTFASLPRPLPGRTNIVITHDRALKLSGALTTSLDEARAIARGDALRRFATEIAVIGGAEIYAQFLAEADRIELTEVHARPEGDTFFAPLDAALWQETERVRHAAGEGDTADFSYVTYRRRTPR